MASRTDSAIDTLDQQDWRNLVSNYASDLWERRLATVDSGFALDVGHHAFLSLADHVAEIDEDAIQGWLADTTEQSIEEASSTPWRKSAPYLGRSSQALEEFIDRAEKAIGLGMEPGHLASQVATPTGDPSVARAISAPWRSAGDEDEILPTPDSVWRGRYAFRGYTTDLVLLDGSTRRLLGTIAPPSARRVRARGSREWIVPDAHGRFRIEPIPPGPSSIEVDTPDGIFATEWALL